MEFNIFANRNMRDLVLMVEEGDTLRIPVKSSTESGHAVQWGREATLVRAL
jgi:hypothetical protein